MRTAHLRLTIVQALYLAGFIAGCAPTVDPAKNSVNQALNAGGQTVTGSIAQMNRSAVRALAEQLPVCIAYQLPGTPPALNDTLKQVLSDVVVTLGKDDAKAIVIKAHQAQRSNFAAVNPLVELIALKNEMPRSYRASKIEFEPLSPLEFRKRASCRGKETVLVVGSETHFYRKELPLATLGAGELQIDSVLFLVLDTAKLSNSRDNEYPRRPI